MPSSLQARMMRRAISPRLAMRMRLNMPIQSAAGVYFEERLVEFDSFTVFAEHGDNFAADLGGDFVEDFHSFDDADGRGCIDSVADFDVGLGLGIRADIKSADHRAFYQGDVGGFGWRGFCRSRPGG